MEPIRIAPLAFLPERRCIMPPKQSFYLELKNARDKIESGRADEINPIIIAHAAKIFVNSIPSDPLLKRRLNLTIYQLKELHLSHPSIDGAIKYIEDLFYANSSTESIYMEAELINLFNTHITNAPMRRSPSEGHSLESLAKIETTLFPIYKKLYDFSRSVIFYHEIDERDELMKMISDMGYHYLLVPLSLKHTPERKIPEKDDYIKIAHDEGHSGIKKLFRPIIRLIFSRMLCTTTDPCLYYFSETGR